MFKCMQNIIKILEIHALSNASSICANLHCAATILEKLKVSLWFSMRMYFRHYVITKYQMMIGSLILSMYFTLILPHFLHFILKKNFVSAERQQLALSDRTYAQ